MVYKVIVLKDGQPVALDVWSWGSQQKPHLDPLTSQHGTIYKIDIQGFIPDDNQPPDADQPIMLTPE